MRCLVMALLLSASFVWAQENSAPKASDNSKHGKDSLTVQGCVSRSSGDYVLIKQNPAMTYQLHATGKVRLRNYLGQRVEITGVESPTLSTSSDALNKTGSASSVTLSVDSIKTIAKECPVH
jgi:hypothetical protein